MINFEVRLYLLPTNANVIYSNHSIKLKEQENIINNFKKQKEELGVNPKEIDFQVSEILSVYNSSNIKGFENILKYICDKNRLKYGGSIDNLQL